MKKIIVADRTLVEDEKKYSFKEKLEIARQLARLGVDVIELPEIGDVRADSLFVKTASAFVGSVLSVAAGVNAESVDLAGEALSSVKNPRIRIELPVSSVGMEYVCHKKGAKMLELVQERVKKALTYCADVEFCALDATRADKEELLAVLHAAKEAGATELSVCDSAGEMMPDDFAAFAEEIVNEVGLPVCVSVNDTSGMAVAAAILAIKKGVASVKTTAVGDGVPLGTFALAMKTRGVDFGMTTALVHTEANRILQQIVWATEREKKGNYSSSPQEADAGVSLHAGADKDEVNRAAIRLGYDLSAEDLNKVYESFRTVAEKKEVGGKDLDAIVAGVSLSVPETYKIRNYIVTSSNAIASCANVELEKDGNVLCGVALGNGPIAAAFLAVEQVVGRHYELDDFRIDAVTEGTEAMGSALVRLRDGGKIYSGNGLSTDIVGASLKAYLAAINKILF